MRSVADVTIYLMKLSVGIVGLPNVGKSTLFNALLQKNQAFAANYPFATIEPNVGVVPLPDGRLTKLAEIVGTKKIVPTTVSFTDIAGLVKGASEGEGLGNAFLAHIRETSLILHVMRDFSDSNVVNTGSGDPLEDYITIETELQLADLASLSRQLEPKGKVEKKELARWGVVVKLKKGLEDGVSARDIELSESEREMASELFLLTMKAELFVFNVDEEGQLETSVRVADAVKIMSEKGKMVSEGDVLVINARLEEELVGFSESEKKEYLREVGVDLTGLEQLILQSYGKLGLISFLTAGEKEVRAWTVTKGSSAPEAAGVIHSDFEKHFINAKVCEYSDFIEYNGWRGVGEVGKVRQEGREYVVREGDVVEFVVSV